MDRPRSTWRLGSKMKITPHLLTVIFGLLVASTSVVEGADFTVCQGIAGVAGTLVDKRDHQTWQQAVDSEFKNVCSDFGKYESNLSSASKSTQAAFGYAGFNLGFGQNASDANATTKQAIDKVCKNGQKFVSQYSVTVDNTEFGRYAANLVDDCLRIVASTGAEALIGQTEVSPTSDSVVFGSYKIRSWS